MLSKTQPNNTPLTIVTICARSGSIGIPGKNIKPLLGKPLIGHTIEQALTLREADHVLVSTDSEEIAAIARTHGAETPFLRPASLATATTGKLDVIAHLVDWAETHLGPIGRIIDLDPTSPLRSIGDIRDCLALLDAETDVVITACEAEKNPYFNMIEYQPDGNVRLVKQTKNRYLSRQSAPKVFSMNASIYVWWRHTLSAGLWNGRTKLHVMPRERSVDIDEPVDFMVVEALMRKANGNIL